MTKAQIFNRDIYWGREGIFRGNLCIEQSKAGIVEIIQNLIDFTLEGELTKELLRQDAGPVSLLDLCLTIHKSLRL